MTHSRQEISRLLEEHGLSPRRAFGQNFVADPNTVRRIARLARVGPDDLVIEIGAGLGSLTLALADTGAQVIAIEVDHGIAPVLRRVVADRSNVTVVEGDARLVDWHALIPQGRSAVVVANLPYNVATPLVADLLDTVPEINRFVVMVQREVALRLAASAGSSEYGAISVKVAYWATARLLGDVPPTVFVPRPKVTSSIIEISRRTSPAVDVAPDDLFPLVRTAFGQRRKMLRRSLSGTVDAAEFDRAGISPTARPEDLDVHAWGRLARTIRDHRRGSRPDASSETVVEETVVQAPAKLTLSLRVTGVRDDGYHLIDAVMTSLDLCDEIRIHEFDPRENLAGTDRDPNARTVVAFMGTYSAGIPTDGTDLVHRALAFVGRSAHVTVAKNIPHGGGLGGGSTDAAAIFRWAGRTAPNDIVSSASIGADVPFCIRGGRATVRGIGEVIDPLPYVHEEYTLIVPPLHVSTPAVYAAWDALGGPSGDHGNDLEPAAIRVEPELGRWRDRIEAACGIRPLLAGSGATWFVPGRHAYIAETLPEAHVRVVATRPSDA